MHILRSFFSLASLTLFSRVSGFFKVAAFAAFYGRTSEADLFLTVMLLPDLVYKFLSEGLISSAAIPIFVDLRQDKAKRRTAFWSLFWVALLISAIISVFIGLNSQKICELITPGFSGIIIWRMSNFWELISIYVIFGLLSGLFTAYLNAQGLFALPALGPIIVNLFIIAGIFGAKGSPVEWIGFSVLLGAFIQTAFLLFLCLKNGVSLEGHFKYLKPDFRVCLSFIQGVMPIAVWISVLPFIPLYERHLLSMLGEGSVATLNYSEKLFNLPLGIISISLARVAFPELSKLRGEAKDNLLNRVLLGIVLILIPVLLVNHFFAESIVAIVFKRGKFSSSDVAIAGKLFRSYSWALIPLSLSLVLNRSFFAERNYLVPFLAGILAASAQFYFGGNFVAKFGIKGIGFAACLAYSIQFLILLLIDKARKKS